MRCNFSTPGASATDEDRVCAFSKTKCDGSSDKEGCPLWEIANNLYDIRVVMEDE